MVRIGGGGAFGHPQARQVAADAGREQPSQVGDNTVRILYQNIRTGGYDDVVSGCSLLKVEPGQGLFLDSSFSLLEEPLQAVGEYHVNQNAYKFYMIDPTEGEMMTGKLLRSNVRVKITITSPISWSAEAFTRIGGNEGRVQPHRFTRP